MIVLLRSQPNALTLLFIKKIVSLALPQPISIREPVVFFILLRTNFAKSDCFDTTILFL